MGKYDNKKDNREDVKEDKAPEMSAAESRAYRASLARPVDPAALSAEEKREKFRIFWAQEKGKYGKTKDLESILWLHLKAMKMDEPNKFEDGIAHFGLKRIK